MNKKESKLKKFVILLRGVMPSGKNRVPMDQLRKILTDAGFENVRTYIQSGNVLVDTKLSARETEDRVHALIQEQIGPDLVVIVRTKKQLQQLLADNPYDDTYDISRVFFVGFKEKPSDEKVNSLASEDFGEEKLVVRDHSAYMYIPGNAARSKLSVHFLEKKLGVSCSARNYNTISKLIELCDT